MPEDAQAPLRNCPFCGHAERTRRERCANCGRSLYARAPRLSPRRRRVALWSAGVLAVAAFVIAAVVLRDVQRDRDERLREDITRAAAAERVRLTRLQAPHRGAAPHLRPPPGATDAQRLHARRALVVAVEAAITRDARGREARGELDGPIRVTECGPRLRSPDAVPDDRDLSKPIGRYDCVAVKADVRQRGESVARLGHPFVAALDFRRFSYVWCRNTPPQSERGEVLVFVRLERPCLAAKGRPLGTGYVDVPDS